MFLLFLAAARSEIPIIGIASHWDDLNDLVLRDYTASVFMAGGIPLILPVTTNATLASEMVERIDGLLLPGGDDVNPLLYGEDPIPENAKFIAELDTFNFLVIDEAKKRQLPIFGICRGSQILNVFFNGTMIQDIDAQVHNGSQVRVKHHQDALKKDSTHWITIAEGSHLQTLMGGRTRATVNSFHHQAVKDVAPGFRVTAVAADGVIEGIENIENPAIFGVQWHPEGPVHSGNDEYLCLFKYLVSEASNVLKRRGAFPSAKRN